VNLIKFLVSPKLLLPEDKSSVKLIYQIQAGNSLTSLKLKIVQK